MNMSLPNFNPFIGFSMSWTNLKSHYHQNNFSIPSGFIINALNYNTLSPKLYVIETLVLCDLTLPEVCAKRKQVEIIANIMRKLDIFLPSILIY